jgi:hypothetical protein
MMATVVFTKSRAGVLGLGLMLVAFLFLGRKIRPGFTAAVLAATLLATPFLPVSFWNRMATIGDEDQDKAEFTGSTEARRILLQEGLDAFLENPMTGVGAGQFKSYNPNGRRERWHETHNSLLQVAADTGIFRFAAFVFLIGCGGSPHSRRDACCRGPGARNRSPGPDSQRRRSRSSAHADRDCRRTDRLVRLRILRVGRYGWTFYYLLALLVARGTWRPAGCALARGLTADSPNGPRRRTGRFERRRRAPRGRPRSPEPRQQRAR